MVRSLHFESVLITVSLYKIFLNFSTSHFSVIRVLVNSAISNEIVKILDYYVIYDIIIAFVLYIIYVLFISFFNEVCELLIYI